MSNELRRSGVSVDVLARSCRAGVLNAEPGGGRAAVPRSGAALSTPGMGDRLGVKVPWRKRWC
jgi:hypothetical protein